MIPKNYFWILTTEETNIETSKKKLKKREMEMNNLSPNKGSFDLDVIFDLGVLILLKDLSIRFSCGKNRFLCQRDIFLLIISHF